MARKVTTEYTCDRCGVKVKISRELQRFKFEKINRGRKYGPVVFADLCSPCESELLASLESFFAGENLPELHAMSREEPA